MIHQPTVHLVLIIAFIVLEGLAAFNVPSKPAFNWLAGGLFCFALSLLF